MIGIKRRLLGALGWLAFGLGWLGVFLPGLPTTVFWIVSALAFIRVNERMYHRVVSSPLFGPAVRLFVEEGRIGRRGKAVSIVSMMGFAALGALAIPPVGVKFLVLGAAAAGSLWVALLPTSERQGPPGRAEAGTLPILTSGSESPD